MSNITVTLVVLAGLAALAGLFLYLTVRDAGRWRKKLDAVLLPIGFEPADEAEKDALEKRLRITHPRHHGKRLLLHLYRRQTTGKDRVYVCDYRFSSASGKASGAAWLLVCLVSETLDLPRVHVEGVPHTPGWMKHLQDAWADAMDSPGAKRWVLGDQDFDRRYRVFHFGQGAAPAWLSRLATILRQMSDGVGVDMEKDVLVLTSIGILADRIRQKLDPQKLLDLMDCANRLREGFALESGADKQHPPPEHAIRLDLTP